MKPVTRIMRPYDGRPSPSDLLELLSYDPDTGELHWKKRDEKWFSDGRHSRSHNAAAWNARYSGKRAFTSLNTGGYFQGELFHRATLAHRVAWAIFYGEWPSDELDHINRDRRDNRVANLRLANRSINCRNQTLTPTETGVVGVNKRRGRKRWHAHIGDGHQLKSLGYFDNLSDAIAARKAAETRLGYDEYRGAEE